MRFSSLHYYELDTRNSLLVSIQTNYHFGTGDIQNIEGANCGTTAVVTSIPTADLWIRIM